MATWRIRLLTAVVFLVGACGTIAGDTASASRTEGAVRVELHSKLVTVHERVSEYLSLYQGFPELPPTATVSEMYAAMERGATPVLPILDSIEASAEDLQAAANRAFEEGVDIGVTREVLDNYFDQYATWLEAHRYQANPDICRETFPPAAEDDLIGDWASEFVSCLTEYLAAPLVQDGVDAANQINAISFQLYEAWS